MTDTPVIALVASQGGLEAVSAVLGALPGDLDATVLVLIHQQPDRLSSLVELLGRRCALPVASAEDGGALRGGTVIVAPPGQHTLVTSGREVLLIASGDAPPSRPSADLLLTTLALAVGPLAYAVVLSGTGHDGATGATAIHKLGGTVVATDEATSTAFSMPHATIERDTVIDHVVRLEAVGPLLATLVNGLPR